MNSVALSAVSQMEVLSPHTFPQEPLLCGADTLSSPHRCYSTRSCFVGSGVYGKPKGRLESDYMYRWISQCWYVTTTRFTTIRWVSNSPPLPLPSGVGSLEGEGGGDFYEQVAQFAKRKGVVISVISIKGADTRLEKLGALADITRGYPIL